MSKEHLFATVGDLRVVGVLTPDESRRENPRASIPGLRIGDYSITEPDGFFAGQITDPIRSEGHFECIGSLVRCTQGVIMTHTRSVKAVSTGSIFGDLGPIQRTLDLYSPDAYLVGVLWHREADFTYNKQESEAAKLWKRELLNVYSRYGVGVMILTFTDMDWPMSAYYDGENTLTLTANQNKQTALFNPQIHFQE